MGSLLPNRASLFHLFDGAGRVDCFSRRYRRFRGAFRRWRSERGRCPIAQSREIFDYFAQRNLVESLDRFNDRDFEMEAFVRSPFHPAFRSGKLIDQFEQAIGFDHCGLGFE